MTGEKVDFRKCTPEELMLIYQIKAPEDAYRAFEELYGRFSGRVYAYLLGKLKNHADAEDLLQKVFFKIHESKHLYKEQFSFEQWLFVIARTAVLDHLRSKARRDRKHELLAGQDDDTGPAEELNLGFLDKLEAKEKDLLTLKFIDELSYQEMAKLLSKSEVSLRKSVSRLISRLKKEEVYE